MLVESSPEGYGRVHRAPAKTGKPGESHAAFAADTHTKANLESLFRVELKAGVVQFSEMATKR